MKKKLRKGVFGTMLACVCLGTVLTTGCGKTESSVTPAEEAKFGKYGQPMPEAAKKYMQEHAAQAQPPRSAAPAK